jgi:hypothetical protein
MVQRRMKAASDFVVAAEQNLKCVLKMKIMNIGGAAIVIESQISIRNYEEENWRCSLLH